MAANRALTGDDILVTLHGRRFGIVGDGSGSGQPTSLVLDNQVVLSKRTPAPVLVKTVGGSNGVGAVAVSGLVVGDTVVNATDVTSPGDVSSSFETTVSVAGQIQQSSAANLSGHQIMFHVWPRS